MDDSLVHSLGNRRRFQRKKDQFHQIKRCSFWVARAIIYNQGNFPFFRTKFLLNFFNPFFKQFRWYPTFWVWMLFTPLKHLVVFDLLVTNIGGLLPFTLPATILVKWTLVCLPPVHFSFLKWYDLLETHW